MGGLLDIRSAAQQLRDMGIKGDTDLVHVNEREKALLKAHGGSGTRNPRTGLLQYEDGGDGGGGDGGLGGHDGRQGFTIEGRLRKFIWHNGGAVDAYYGSILREEV